MEFRQLQENDAQENEQGEQQIFEGELSPEERCQQDAGDDGKLPRGCGKPALCEDGSGGEGRVKQTKTDGTPEKPGCRGFPDAGADGSKGLPAEQKENGQRKEIAQ